MGCDQCSYADVAVPSLAAIISAFLWSLGLCDKRTLGLSSQPVVPAWPSPLDDVTGFLGLTHLLAAGDATKPRYLEDGVDAEYLSD